MKDKIATYTRVPVPVSKKPRMRNPHLNRKWPHSGPHPGVVGYKAGRSVILLAGWKVGFIYLLGVTSDILSDNPSPT